MLLGPAVAREVELWLEGLKGRRGVVAFSRIILEECRRVVLDMEQGRSKLLLTKSQSEETTYVHALVRSWGRACWGASMLC